MAGEPGGDTSLRHAREWLETPGATAAAQALIINSACHDGAVKATRPSLRYAFVVRCRAEVESGEEHAFLEISAEAFDGPLTGRMVRDPAIVLQSCREGRPTTWLAVGQPSADLCSRQTAAEAQEDCRA